MLFKEKNATPVNVKSINVKNDKIIELNNQLTETKNDIDRLVGELGTIENSINKLSVSKNEALAKAVVVEEQEKKLGCLRLDLKEAQTKADNEGTAVNKARRDISSVRQQTERERGERERLAKESKNEFEKMLIKIHVNDPKAKIQMNRETDELGETTKRSNDNIVAQQQRLEVIGTDCQKIDEDETNKVTNRKPEQDKANEEVLEADKKVRDQESIVEGLDKNIASTNTMLEEINSSAPQYMILSICSWLQNKINHNANSVKVANGLIGTLTKELERAKSGVKDAEKASNEKDAETAGENQPSVDAKKHPRSIEQIEQDLSKQHETLTEAKAALIKARAVHEVYETSCQNLAWERDNRHSAASELEKAKAEADNKRLAKKKIDDDVNADKKSIEERRAKKLSEKTAVEDEIARLNEDIVQKKQAHDNKRDSNARLLKYIDDKLPLPVRERIFKDAQFAKLNELKKEEEEEIEKYNELVIKRQALTMAFLALGFSINSLANEGMVIGFELTETEKKKAEAELDGPNKNEQQNKLELKNIEGRIIMLNDRKRRNSNKLSQSKQESMECTEEDEELEKQLTETKERVAKNHMLYEEELTRQKMKVLKKKHEKNEEAQAKLKGAEYALTILNRQLSDTKDKDEKTNKELKSLIEAKESELNMIKAQAREAEAEIERITKEAADAKEEDDERVESYQRKSGERQIWWTIESDIVYKKGLKKGEEKAAKVNEEKNKEVAQVKKEAAERAQRAEAALLEAQKEIDQLKKEKAGKV
ncbi:hypothetical protein AGMMS49936_06960 [Endomicrobiia bacterium]|nr:hypothetical protein AGMMS49936_06960 [Endomicrobiia bacterium]